MAKMPSKLSLEEYWDWVQIPSCSADEFVMINVSLDCLLVGKAPAETWGLVHYKRFAAGSRLSITWPLAKVVRWIDRGMFFTECSHAKWVIN
jgi:hypothetical protein